MVIGSTRLQELAGGTGDQSKITDVSGQACSRSGTFTPFHNRIFLSIWIASLVSNFGSLIQGVGASWLMTTMSTSASMVTLVTASTSLPIVLFSLAAGASADVWDRRLVMLAAQTLMLLVSGILTLLAWWHLVTPWILLGLTFLLGCGAALNGPAWQASVGEQVPRRDLPGAVALNSIGFNLARVVGPAIGGIVVAAAGSEAAFALNTVSYIGLIVVLARWHRPTVPHELPPELIVPAMWAGLRYALLSPEIRTVMLRAFVFGLFASSISALLPLIARGPLNGTSLTFGLLLGSFGVGAVLGALLSVRLRARFSNENVLRGVSLLFAGGNLAIAFSASLLPTLVALLAAGASWVLALSMFNVIVQLSTPRWVMGRTVAVMQMVAYAGFAAGSLAWGLLTETHGLTLALTVSAIGIAASVALGIRAPIGALQGGDGTSPIDRSHLSAALDVDPPGGPVVTTVCYRVELADARAFVVAMWRLRSVRRRNGGRRWALLRDNVDPGIWVERFESRTWLDHLRLSARGTVNDDAIRQQARAFDTSANPRVAHLLEISPSDFDEQDDAADSPRTGTTTDPQLLAASNVLQ